MNENGLMFLAIATSRRVDIRRSAVSTSAEQSLTYSETVDEDALDAFLIRRARAANNYVSWEDAQRELGL